MSTAPQNLEELPKSLMRDPRWALARRIAGSEAFARSERLPKLLLYICRMTIADRSEELNEQRIGVEVFGRSPNYDPGADGIVRSHATRLRQRLEAYFNSEGIHEPLRVEVPRGGYVPRFYAAGNELVSVREAPTPVDAPPAPSPEPSHGDPPLTAPVTAQPRFLWVRPFIIGLALAAAAIALFLHLRHDQRAVAGNAVIHQSPAERRFWSSLFPQNGRTLIVPGDSGLVLYETLTGRQLTLSDYIGGSYRDPNNDKHAPSTASQDLTMNLAGRRYTSIVDLNLTTQISHLPQWNSAHADVVFARDLRPADADGANLILIGSKEATPWVSLVEPSLNFVLTADKKWGFGYINKHPQKGELAEYTPQEATGGIGAPDVYGDVAYVPSPSGKGMVLVLGGLWMSGTRSAADFVLDGPRFSAWLTSIARPDGTIPPFELLISTKSLESTSTYSTIIAKRVYSQ